jgi:hypothetical protein
MLQRYFSGLHALLENLETDIQKFPDVLDTLYKNAKPLCETIQLQYGQARDAAARVRVVF